MCYACSVDAIACVKYRYARFRAAPIHFASSLIDRTVLLAITQRNSLRAAHKKGSSHISGTVGEEAATLRL